MEDKMIVDTELSTEQMYKLIRAIEVTNLNQSQILTKGLEDVFNNKLSIYNTRNVGINRIGFYLSAETKTKLNKIASETKIPKKYIITQALLSEVNKILE
jgi:hypothetical protein